MEHGFHGHPPGEHNRLDARVTLLDFAQQSQAVLVWHINVQNCNSNTRFAKNGDCGHGIAYRNDSVASFAKGHSDEI